MTDEAPACPHCGKPEFLCVCAQVEPLKTRTGLLILQHPQEQDRLLGTAGLTRRALENSVLKVGLSWPSLSKALGRDADPSQWAILHLGASRAADLPRDRELVALDKKGAALPDQDKALGGLKGVVVFDGSWSQAKTLWWRNPWVLKAKRLALNPRKKSLYGALRREPRREALSTLEAAALALSRLDGKPDIETVLLQKFTLMLDVFRAAQAQGLVSTDGKKSAPPAA
ncbi:DTW domain-containing protein [Rhodoblastus acidophilus]|uniref:tRNA-uridine aminocarboxypropyltransferase n=1 Tax=Rhodoblastus acidophilus TaxID=1074 RepID=A0A6N8DK26_RHOAC|nr:tRNA-uridine aminocarboxypropyltransferase [Rhodoblastus acidophilus]MCW2272962.1 DTW domain-containing protein YfiP [Rhodoblastus acidophilus]MTV29865.1 DTW domain-containing protein [Rhodoblastus acidophilus]